MTMMKNFALVVALGFALLAPLAVQAGPSAQGCKSSDNKPKKCDSSAAVPEPGILVLLSAGLLGLGGVTALRRKKRLQ
jgi:PEP-CTERM motif